MLKTTLKLSAAISLLTVASFTQAARDPSVRYASELQNVKLQFPGSSDEVCESGSSYPSCIGFRDWGLWWMNDRNSWVRHKINGDDPDRNEMRNKKEFNMLTSTRRFSGSLKRSSASGFNQVTILQLHRSVSGSKPVLRVEYNRSKGKYEFEVASNEKASNGYCKKQFSTSGSGTKSFSITQVGSKSNREISVTLAGQTLKCPVDDWPSDSTYYYKMGTYLSDGDGLAEFQFINWDWNQ